MKKKLLMYTNYFYPEVATTGQILTELAEGLSDTFDITVICEVPSYAQKLEDKYKTKRYYFEDYKGIKVVRVRVPEVNKQSKVSRVKYILSYFLNCIGATFKVGKFDLVFTVTQPPVLGGILGTIGKRITGGGIDVPDYGLQSRTDNSRELCRQQTGTIGYDVVGQAFMP